MKSLIKHSPRRSYENEENRRFIQQYSTTLVTVWQLFAIEELLERTKNPTAHKQLPHTTLSCCKDRCRFSISSDGCASQQTFMLQSEAYWKCEITRQTILLICCCWYNIDRRAADVEYRSLGDERQASLPSNQWRPHDARYNDHLCRLHAAADCCYRRRRRHQKQTASTSTGQ